MALTSEQIKTLLKMVAATQEDCLDCSHCLDHIAEFAEQELTGRTLCESMKAIRIHLESCPCCHHEYQMLLEALATLGDPTISNEGDC